MIFSREITPHLISCAQQFPVVGVIGPRQSGKTTLVKKIFKDYAYVTLEDVDMRRAAQEDPRRFLAAYDKQTGVIIDEIQEVPHLFSYLQGIVDQNNRPGFFIITGSQNFLLYEKITQSLAGRIALLTLLPLTVDELKLEKMLPDTLEELMFKGCYPRLYAQSIDTQTWFTNYSATYVERDVRQVLQISDVVSFQRFIKLCAARVGSLINYADLARDCDISPNTAKAWLSILESSYIIFFLSPHYSNFSKRIIKNHKLYFYDTGLVCSLLGIKNAQELYMHPMRGNIFETFIMSELFKNRYNLGKRPSLYFWRDVQGHEVDCIFEKRVGTIVPIEIKSGMTLTSALLTSLKDWQRITKQEHIPAYLVYAGKLALEYEQAHVIPWDQVKNMLQKIDESNESPQESIKY